MIAVCQHRPGFVDGDPAQATEVASMAEVLTLPWVAQWEKLPGFFRWSISWEDRRGTLPVLLMAETNGGREWYVAALVYGLAWTNVLPAWEAPSAE
jgi:hypothetical protein